MLKIFLSAGVRSSAREDGIGGVIGLGGIFFKDRNGLSVNDQSRCLVFPEFPKPGPSADI